MLNGCRDMGIQYCRPAGGLNLRISSVVSPHSFNRSSYLISLSPGMSLVSTTSSYSHNCYSVYSQVYRSMNKAFRMPTEDLFTDHTVVRLFSDDIHECGCDENVSGYKTIRLFHEFSKARQPLDCDVIVSKQIIFN